MTTEEWIELGKKGQLSIEDVAAQLETSSRGKIINSLHNCTSIFRYDPMLAGALSLNRLDERIYVTRPLGWPRYGGPALGDDDFNRILLYVETAYGITSTDRVRRGMTISASDRAYHPTQDLLSGLKWDGMERVRYALHHFLGAEINDYTYEANMIQYSPIIQLCGKEFKMQYLGVCRNCLDTYYVDSPTEVNKCHCGGDVVVGVPPVSRKDFENAMAFVQQEMIQDTLDSYEAFLEEKQKEELRQYKEKEKQRLEQQQKDARAKLLASQGGYYEYKTISIEDESGGALSTSKMDETLNMMADKGWVLKVAYSNIIGENSHVETHYEMLGNPSVRVNSTICEHVLIFERYNKQ